jgi:hypothetical protein
MLHRKNTDRGGENTDPFPASINSTLRAVACDMELKRRTQPEVGCASCLAIPPPQRPRGSGRKDRNPKRSRCYAFTAYAIGG